MGLASTRHTILRAILSGMLVTNAVPVLAQSNEPAAKSGDNEIKINVGTGVDISANSVDAYALVEHIDQQWRIVSISRKQPVVTDPDKQELLAFGRNLNLVEPVFSEYIRFMKQHRFYQNPKNQVPHDPYVCVSKENKDRPRYNPCDSKLTIVKDLGKSVFNNVALAALTFGISLASKGTESYVSVDKEKVLSVLRDTNLLDEARTAVRLAAYRESFQKAKTIDHYRRFIEKYRNDDPEGLISQAEANIFTLEGVEKARRLEDYRKHYAAAKSSYDLQAFIQRYESNDPDNLVPKARQGLKVAEREELRQAQEADARAKKMAAAEAERRQRAAAALASWRGKLRIGDDTFCGPVIELRQPMIKIAIRAQLPGYATETWLKAGEVFPPDYGCENINGRLRPVG